MAFSSQWLGYRGGVLNCLPLAHSVYLLGLLEETTYCLPPGDEEQEEQEEEAPRPSLTIPEDLDSKEAMVSWVLPCPFSSLPLWSLEFLPSHFLSHLPGSQWSDTLASENKCSLSTFLPLLS